MKKIDLEKSKIMGVNEDDSDNLKLGIRGYFSHYSDFETYTEGDLEGFTYSEYMTTEEDPDGDYGDQWYDYFIPEDKVVFKEEEPKKKTLRPFKSIDEFFDTTGFKIGDVVDIQRFGNYTYKETSILNGVRVFTDEDEELQKKQISFGSGSHSFDELFNNFKYYKKGEWLRFGVEE